MKNNNQLIKKGNFVLFSMFSLMLLFHQSAFAFRPIDRKLHQAVFCGSIQETEEFIHNGANVNFEDSFGSSPLHVAAQRDYGQLLLLLIKRGAHIDAINSIKQTPLHIAAEYGRSEIVRLLLKNNANIEALDEFENTPLYYAIENEHSDVMQILIEKSIHMNISEKYMNTLLHHASSYGDSETVSLLLKRGAKFNAFNNLKSFLFLAVGTYDQQLHQAVNKGCIQKAEEFINNGANVNFEYLLGQSPLHVAAEMGYDQLLLLLIKRGAHVDAIDSSQQTPLHLAAEHGRSEIVRLLLKNNANIEALDRFKNTPLEYAMKNGHSDTVQILLDKLVNINTSDGYIDTLLYQAATRGYVETVSLLLKRGAIIDTAHDFKKTALHSAAEMGHIKVVRLLLDNKANIDASNEAKETPLDAVARRGNRKIVQLLLERGAQVHVLNEADETSLDHALFFFGNLPGFDHPIHRIDINRLNIFIELLLWYSYHVSIPNSNHHETPEHQAIEELIRFIEERTDIFLPADQEQYFFHAKSLSRWIINEASHCQSKKQFLEKILNFLLESNSTEQQNLLKKNVKYLLLKNYLLNQDSSDFYDFKKKLSSICLKKLKALEDFLKYTYAKKLKKELFHDLSQEALEIKLNDLSSLRKITDTIIKYCQDSAIKQPFLQAILGQYQLNKNEAITKWVENYHPKDDPTAKTIHSNIFKTYAEHTKRLVLDIYMHLNYIAQNSQHKSSLNSNTSFGKNKNHQDILLFKH